MPHEICSDAAGCFFFFSLCTLWPRLLAEILSFLPTTQHTRWDSSAHTVTQAFRHSLAPTNTISVTFHYMVLGWISGLETHQISTQGALPPNAQYCLSATMWNCLLFALSCLKYKYVHFIWINAQTENFSLTCKRPYRPSLKATHIPPLCGSSC